MLTDSPTTNATRLVVPVTVALAAGWIVATLVYGAGSKVAGSEKEIGFLTSKCDDLHTQILEAKTHTDADHDKIISLMSEVATLKEEEAGKDIHIDMGDPKKK